MRALLRYLFTRSMREKLPRLGGKLKLEFDPLELDSDISLVLMSGRARDVQEARNLMRKYGAANGAELLMKLPPPPPVDWKRRFRAWLRHLEGSYETDPHRRELTETKKGTLL